jgi:hypothetical protein
MLISFITHAKFVMSSRCKYTCLCTQYTELVRRIIVTRYEY